MKGTKEVGGTKDNLRMKNVGQISGGLDDRNDAWLQRNDMITLNRYRRYQIRHMRTMSLSNSMTQSHVGNWINK